jgi:hypothetical protein
MTNNLQLNIGQLYDIKGEYTKKLTRVLSLMHCKRRVKALGYTWNDVLDKKRHRHLVDLRKIVCKYLYDKGWTYKGIGGLLKLNHATIIHHKNQFENLLGYDAELQTLWIKFKNS